jgi:hypothetical protein
MPRPIVLSPMMIIGSQTGVAQEQVHSNHEHNFLNRKQLCQE